MSNSPEIHGGMLLSLAVNFYWVEAELVHRPAYGVPFEQRCNNTVTKTVHKGRFTIGLRTASRQASKRNRSALNVILTEWLPTVALQPMESWSTMGL